MQIKSVCPIPAERVLEKRNKVKNVAAYCRVSTELEQQQNSLTLQIEYYTQFIKKHKEWNFAGVYADNASGRNTKRKQFQQMLSDCLDGKIDLILIKSISRLGRNTVDLLKTCRELKANDVDVFFETENIYLSKQKDEILLSIMASLYQNESQVKSESIKWGIRAKFANGTSGFINRKCYGYRRSKDGLEIIENEAAIVRKIYAWSEQGLSLRNISRQLRKEHIPAPRGGSHWSIETIRKILANEKYKGVVILQKTYVSDFFTGKQKKNNFRLEKYEISIPSRVISINYNLEKNRH